jgi:ABC-type phosphate/phosphonate transport system substrate-binding protein
MPKFKKNWKEEFIKLIVRLVLLTFVTCLLIIPIFRFFFPPTIQASSLTIGVLWKPSEYQKLTTYLRSHSQIGNKVQIVIDGDESLSYEEARTRMINKEWDIAFTLSPILSIAAKNNDYHYAATMFPNYPPYYQATLFTKSNSSIKSVSNLKPTNTIAMGDFNSASSFYVAAYDLFGKTLRVDMGHKSSKIKELVKTGKADIGAAAYEAVKDDKDLKIIHLSRKIPGAGVYLSPKLSGSDREIIKKVLLDAPPEIKKQANYGSAKEPDYSQLIKISYKAEDVLRCANFQKNPVNFYCPSSTSPTGDISEILGQINGWTKVNDETESFKLSGKDNKAYEIIIPRKILDQVPGASNAISLQGKQVKIINVIPQKQGGIFKLRIAQPNQLIVLGND